MNRRLLAIAILVPLGGLALGSMVYAVRTARVDSADLERRAEEVGRFRDRLDPYDDDGRDNAYPPSALPVFAAIVPTGSVMGRRWTWIALNLGALAAIAAIVAETWGRSWPWWAKWGFGLGVAASKPARAGIALGQFHLIPVALILGAEASLLRRHRALCGVLTGLALIKPTMSAPYALLLAARREWTALGVALAVQGGLALGGSAWLGIGPATLAREWLRNARLQQAAGTIDVPSLLARGLGGASPGATSASVVLLAASGAVLWSLRARSSLGLTSLATFFAAVIAYHRHYDMVLLLPALAYLIDGAIRGRSVTRWTIAAAFGLALILPSQGRSSLVSETTHDLMFVVMAYSVMVLILATVAREQPSAVLEEPPP